MTGKGIEKGNVLGRLSDRRAAIQAAMRSPGDSPERKKTRTDDVMVQDESKLQSRGIPPAWPLAPSGGPAPPFAPPGVPSGGRPSAVAPPGAPSGDPAPALIPQGAGPHLWHALHADWARLRLRGALHKSVPGQ